MNGRLTKRVYSIIINNDIVINNDNERNFADLDAKEKANLLIHPVRLKIVQVLAGAALTTQQISEALPGIPKSSIYRHLKRLLDGGLVCIASTVPVKGVEEKVYTLAQAPHLDQNDVRQMTKDEHMRLFAAYLGTLLHDFTDYLDSSDQHDFLAERTGYSELRFFASISEMDEFGRVFGEALSRLAANPPSPDRLPRKMVFINHPDIRKEIPHES